MRFDAGDRMLTIIVHADLVPAQIDFKQFHLSARGDNGSGEGLSLDTKGPPGKVLKLCTILNVATQATGTAQTLNLGFPARFTHNFRNCGEVLMNLPHIAIDRHKPPTDKEDQQDREDDDGLGLGIHVSVRKWMFTHAAQPQSHGQAQRLTTMPPCII